jgi:hypothetical protein
MTKNAYNRMTVTQQINGVESIVNTEPGEIYIDIPATNPRYIHVQEGYHLVEGDIRSRRREELESPALTKWLIGSISEDMVTGTDTETGESIEWEREWLVKHLGVGEYSVGLRDFGRVSVAGSGTWEHPSDDERSDDLAPVVIISVYANNGERFTQQYAAETAGDWESLTLIDQDPRIDRFDPELRERFDDAVATALDIEQQYTQSSEPNADAA